MRLRHLTVPIGAALHIACAAQQYGFIQYTTREGLAQSQLRCMAQDSLGYLWFGTVGGASRFDGAHFSNHALREGLPDAQITALHTDRKGTLWLAAGAALLRWSGTRFVPVLAFDDAAAMRITVMTDDANGVVYLGTERGGVVAIGRDGVRHDLACPADSMPAIRALRVDPDGALLAGSRNGLWVHRSGAWSPIELGDRRRKSISAIAAGAAGESWIGTQGDGLFHMRGNNTIGEYSVENGLLQNQVRCVLMDDRGRVWVGSKVGLNVIDQRRVRTLTVHQGLPNDNIFCGMMDDQGQLWFGTDGAGVLRYTGERFVALTTTDGVCSDQVMSFVEDDRGDLWLGTYGSGVCRLDAMAMITTLDSLPNNTVWCGLRDRAGHSWFGTSDGLCRVVNGVVELNARDIGIPEGRTFSLYEDPSGTIWCGQREHLVAILPGDSVVLYPVGPGGPGRSIRAITGDHRGRLWMATDDGITVKEGSVFSRIAVDKGLCDDHVFCLLVDRNERLWAGTTNGLSCMDHGRFTCLRFGLDFGANNVNALLLDGEGAVWAGTNNGLFRFHPDSLLHDPSLFQAYDANDGLRSMEFNQNAVFRDRSGRLFFGSANGIVVHDPARASLHAAPRAPRTHLLALRSYLNTTDWRRQCDSISGVSGLPVGLHLPHARNHLTFDYGAINTDHPERTRYRYRLIGHDTDPLPATDARFATYSNLGHGAYTFEVVASTNGRDWGAPATITFTVDAPFWSRWWFFTLCGSVLLLIAYGLHRVRAARRERREKTRQLMLRSRMLQLEQQALNANMNRHFVFNALNSIQYYINRQDRNAANRYLTSFAKLIRKNLDASQGDTTTLAEELERLELYLVLEHMRFKDKFTYSLDHGEDFPLDRVNIPAMMLQPYVENSIWHGILPMDRPGHVAIALREVEHGRVQVVIEDDGVGIEKSLNDKGNAQGDHISRGIEITKGRADVLRRLELADIRISGPEQLHHPDGSVRGTRVVVDLPVEGVMKSVRGMLRTPGEAITFEAR